MKAMGDELMWKNFRPKTTVSSVSTFRDHIIDLFGKAKALARKVFEIAQFLSSGHYPVWSKKLKFNKTVGFLDIRRVVPTIIGMPINLIVSAAGHMEFNFTSFVEYKTDHPFKVIVKWITSMFGDKPHEALDAHIVIQPRYVDSLLLQSVLTMVSCCFYIGCQLLLKFKYFLMTTSSSQNLFSLATPVPTLLSASLQESMTTTLSMYPSLKCLTTRLFY